MFGDSWNLEGIKQIELAKAVPKAIINKARVIANTKAFRECI
jgi:hypothetical protein